MNAPLAAEDRSAVDWRAGCECNRVGLCFRCRAADKIERLERALAETHDAWTAETAKRLQSEQLLRDAEDPVSGQLAEARRNLALYKGYSSRERRYQIEIEGLERLQKAIGAVTRTKEP